MAIINIDWYVKKKTLFLFVTLKIPLYLVKIVEGILNFYFWVFNGCDKYFPFEDLSISINMCSSTFGLVLKAICSKTVPGSSIYCVWTLSEAFPNCCSFCISPLLCNSSLRLLAFSEYRRVQSILMLVGLQSIININDVWWHNKFYSLTFWIIWIIRFVFTSINWECWRRVPIIVDSLFEIFSLDFVRFE